ncbi:Glutathione S-transferase omega-like 2 [Cladobotryum mycophilum]|uniref:Glutathione S-transferase omega-like 2 n=1 Tax=Cladobotryum mycophilum TaxID=491253 RepID=A0ABR0SI94_9HYPO
MIVILPSIPSPKAPVHDGPEDSWHGVIRPGGQFPPEAGRYHLYIGLFCPSSHRVNLVRYLKGLQSIIDISVVMPYPKGDEKGWPGWRFPDSNDEYDGATVDKLFGSKFLHEIYFRDDPDYKGRYSVPLLWDKKGGKIVSNESAEMLRWLPTAFDDVLHQKGQQDLNFYPKHLRTKIDEISLWMERDLNTGVYKAGFATVQEWYDNNVPTVFAALNYLEEIIHRNGGPYVLGKELTEIDIRAYATIVRFDSIYVQHLKCNLGTTRGNYPVTHEWFKNLYWNVKGFRETTNFRHIKEGYTKTNDKINPLAITPMGPFPDVEEGVDLDFAKLKLGVIRHPAVLERQKELYS